MENTIENALNEIYLNIGSDGEILDFYELAEVTWCADKVSKSDIKYIRADFANSQITHHLDKLTEEIKENVEIHYLASNNLNPSVNRESITNTLNEYKLKHKLKWKKHRLQKR